MGLEVAATEERSAINSENVKAESERLKNTSKDREKGLYLFVSFDLVNSTSFKSKAEDGWPAVTVSFYNAVTSMMKEGIGNINIWKYLGDEIVFYYNVKNIGIVYDIPDKLYNIQETVSNEIRNKTEKSVILDIKCTAWLAGITRVQVGDVESSEFKIDKLYRNVHIPLSSNDKAVHDFLGADIDIGFRIAEYSNKRRITLSAEYAYLLYHLSKPTALRKIDSRLKIVAFKEVKGIWGGRAYPIIWYFKDWENSDDSFDYDEHINNDIIENISKRKGVGYLEKVFKEAGQKEYIDKFIEMCQGYNEEKEEGAVSVKDND